MLIWKPILTITVTVVCIAGAAVVHGRQTDRWGVSTALQEAADRLDAVPAGLGDWVGEDVHLDPGSLEVANVARHVSRRYKHRFTGEEVTVLIVCGRPGHAAAHPPDVCYKASGYEVGPKKVRELAGHGTVWQADFTRTGAADDRLRIVWAWGLGAEWTAAAAPRIEFARSPYLYKTYLIQRAAEPEGADAPLPPFVNLFLSECQRSLAAAGG
ncbi:exosortase-associated EpsI family protein [Limnoglobus roseus]|uniref:Exosortase-associated EpsI family protein n=1 Tax=Limnoglobus roseus TaxID=2598579 RepID=A0A5C1ABY6_9BACT|nr:exosortase-associated EpsI family protein [Limnoglobus roseus]QEL15546.1 exosortase-associated EpsI family protein [Limnoglobus roseus]